MRAHNGHWRRLYIDNAVAERPISAMVFTGQRLWPATFVLDAKPAGAVTGRYISQMRINQICQN